MELLSVRWWGSKLLDVRRARWLGHLWERLLEILLALLFGLEAQLA